jgi:hypothetical protein
LNKPASRILQPTKEKNKPTFATEPELLYNQNKLTKPEQQTNIAAATYTKLFFVN